MAKSNNETRFAWVKHLAIALTAMAGVIAMQFFLPPEGSPLKKRNVADKEEALRQEKQEALRLEILKAAPTFGFDNLIADWTFLQFLQYFGDNDARNKTGYSLSGDYFDIVTKLNPRWVDIYLFVSNSLSIYEGKPKEGVEYMTRGVESLSPEIHPDAWLVPRYKGIDQLLLVGDVEGSIESHELAAKWAKGTDDEQLVPLFERTAEYLRENPDNKSIKINAWLWVYYQTRDQKVRDRATQELLDLGVKKEEGEDGEIKFVVPKSEE
jgi:hypothetical protein